MINFKLALSFLVTAVFGSFVAHGADQAAFAQRLENTAEINEAGAQWYDAFIVTTGNTNVQPVHVLMFLAQLDQIWDATNRLQHDVSKQLLARTKTFTRDSLRAWQEALERVNSKTTGPTVLSLLIQQETLFDKSVLKVERATKLLARLKSLSPKLVAEWSEAHRLGSREYAAFALISFDSVFNDEKVEEIAFQKQVAEAKSSRKK